HAQPLAGDAGDPGGLAGDAPVGPGRGGAGLMRRVASRTGAAPLALLVALVLTLSACGESSKKAATKGGSTSTLPTNTSTTETSGGGNTSSTETATSAPGSPDPYGPSSPTSTTGLGRLLVKNGYAR